MSEIGQHRMREHVMDKNEIERIARAAYEHPSWWHKQPWEKNPWARNAWINCMTDVLAPPAKADPDPMTPEQRKHNAYCFMGYDPELDMVLD